MVGDLSVIGEISTCLFESNQAQGGDSGGAASPGDGLGGALHAGPDPTIDRLRDTYFHHNKARGGTKVGIDGETLASGGAIHFAGDRLGAVERNTFYANQAIGGAASSALARGGAMHVSGSEPPQLFNNNFYGNRAIGGTANDPGDPGADAFGGALDLNGSFGGAIYANTFARNEAQGGVGAAGTGGGVGGAIRIHSGAAGVHLGGNLFSDNRTALSDGASTPNDCFDATGAIVSDGWNLVQAPGNCPFAGTGDQIGVASRVYALDDWGCASPLPNGNCLPTLAIDQDSPAADQSSCTALAIAVDAREIPRLFDLIATTNAADGCDIGAFEAVDADGDGFTEADDCAPNDPNAFAVDSCGICGGDGTMCPIFADDFESGDMLRWTATVP